jgi:16S rRNA (guanine527-N7)-methyltransferase
MSVTPAPPEPMLLKAASSASSFDAGDFQAAARASDAQMAQLEQFRALLSVWNTRMNLVGPSALAEFWGRHAWDSAQLLDIAPRARTWADLGPGAGFPGLVLAILLKGRPGARVHLVESVAKRCRFLEEAVATLALPAQIHHARAETMSLQVDIVTARACAPMVKLLGHAWPYLFKGATGLFLKGQDVEVELVEATKYWKFAPTLIPSRSHTDGRIVKLKGIARVRAL